MKRIYLASPYTGTDAQQEDRYIKVCKAAADVIRMDPRLHRVFSPIAHSHGIAVHGNLKGDHETWKDQNLWQLEYCDELWVATIEGWGASEGIKWEIETVMSLGKRVKYYAKPL